MSLNENQPANPVNPKPAPECLCKTDNFWVRCPIHDSVEPKGHKVSTQDCRKSPISGRVCECGTKGCEVYHSAGIPAASKAGVDLKRVADKMALGIWSASPPYSRTELERVIHASLQSVFESIKSVAPSVVAGVEEKRWMVCDKGEIGVRDIMAGDKVICDDVPTFKVYIICDAHNASLGEPRGGVEARQDEPRARTFLRSMIHAIDSGDSDTYWLTLGLLNTLHHEMIESESFAPSVGASNAVLPHPVSERTLFFNQTPVGSTATGVESPDQVIEIDEHGKVHDPLGQVPPGVPIRENPVPSLSEPKELEEE